MMVNDLPYLETISQRDETKGGKQNKYYDNRAAAISSTYADGLETLVASGTSVYVERGYSRSGSFSQAQSSGSNL